jgi:hypothetical protein
MDTLNSGWCVPVLYIMYLVVDKRKKGKRMHSVGFEPTHTNIFELESNALDRSAMNAYVVNY